MIPSIILTPARENHLLPRRRPVQNEGFAPQSSLFRAHSRVPRFPERRQAVPSNLPTATCTLLALIPAPPPF